MGEETPPDSVMLSRRRSISRWQALRFFASLRMTGHGSFLVAEALNRSPERSEGTAKGKRRISNHEAHEEHEEHEENQCLLKFFVSFVVQLMLLAQ